MRYMLETSEDTVATRKS